MIFTKLLLDVDVVYEFTDIRCIRTHVCALCERNYCLSSAGALKMDAKRQRKANFSDLEVEV